MLLRFFWFVCLEIFFASAHSFFIIITTITTLHGKQLMIPQNLYLKHVQQYIVASFFFSLAIVVGWFSLLVY